MRNLLALFFAFIFISVKGECLLTATISAENDTLTEIPFNRYEGGDIGFNGFLKNNTKFPTKSEENLTVGIFIVALTIDPVGDILKMVTLAPLDTEIEKEIFKTIMKTKKNWLPGKDDSNMVLLIPFKFILNGFEYFTNDIPDNFMGEISVLTFSRSSDKGLLHDDYYITAYSNAKSKNNYHGMALSLKELLRRNPFNEELVSEYIRVQTILKNEAESCKWINNYQLFFKKPSPISLPCNDSL